MQKSLSVFGVLGSKLRTIIDEVGTFMTCFVLVPVFIAAFWGLPTLAAHAWFGGWLGVIDLWSIIVTAAFLLAAVLQLQDAVREHRTLKLLGLWVAVYTFVACGTALLGSLALPMLIKTLGAQELVSLSGWLGQNIYLEIGALAISAVLGLFLYEDPTHASRMHRAW